MHIRHIIAIAAVAAASAHTPYVHADAQLQYEGGPGGAIAVAISRGRTSITSQRSQVLHQNGTDAVVIVDHSRSAYSVMDAKATDSIAAQQSASNAQMAAALKQMESQLANLPADQRKALEKMLEGRTAALQPKRNVTRSVAELGEATVGRWRCALYQFLENGKPVQEMCVVPAAELGVSQSDFATLRETLKTMGAMTQRMGANTAALGDLEKVNGIPVQVRMLSTGQVSRLKNVSTSPVNPDTLNVPKNYSRNSFGG